MWILDYIWHSVWAQLSLLAIAIIILLAVAWFVPLLRRWAIGAAGLLAAAATIYAKGASDARRADKARQAAAEKRSIEQGQADRAAADADAARGVRDGGDRDE